MTRSAVVLALVVALTFAARSFVPEGMPRPGSGAALAFGFLLIAAIQLGHIFNSLRLPHLTGYLLCGAVFGPEILNLVGPRMLHDLTLVKRVAVGLIALLAGCELNLRALAPRLRGVAAFSIGGLASAGALLFLFFFVLAPGLPFAAGMSIEQRAVVALVFANALCALSPAAVMGILTETGARGPLSELVLSIVVLADLAIVISITFTQSLSATIFGGQAAGGSLGYHIFASIGVGVLIGAILAVFIQRVGKRVGLFVFGVLFVVAEAGGALHLDPLLVGLAAGLFLENVSPVGGGEVIKQTEVASLPTFAVFFAVVGAEVHLSEFVAVFAYALGAAATRALGLAVGVRLARPLAGVEPALARLVPLGMIPQAGVAIAVANMVRERFEPWGPSLATLLLGTIVCNELVGPILFRLALQRAGEIGRRHVADLSERLELDLGQSTPPADRRDA